MRDDFNPVNCLVFSFRRASCHPFLRYAGTFDFAHHDSAGARVALNGDGIRVEGEGRTSKIVEQVEQVSFSGPRAVVQGQDTERCVMRPTASGPTVTELTPGIDLEREVPARADVALKVAADLEIMPAALYRPETVGLTLRDDNR